MKLKGVIKHRYYPGDRIDYECYRGYFYVWPYLLSATCEPNGSWSRIEEACLSKETKPFLFLGFFFFFRSLEIFAHFKS